MRVSVLSRLGSLGLRRIITIVLSASFVGVVVGYALATLSNGDEAGSTALRPSPASRSPRAAQPRAGLVPFIAEAILKPAATPSGIRRRRARLTLVVTIRNTSGRPRAVTAAPLLLVGRRRVRADPAAASRARGLLKRIAGSATVTGVLRFETSYDVTDQLRKQRQALLRISRQTLPFEIEAP